MPQERILVVDDEQNARSALKSILGEEGYDVAEASDGEEALARIEDFNPAVVLTDVRMPKMDGITLLQRARERGSQAVFVVMTAYASIEAAVEAMRLGGRKLFSQTSRDEGGPGRAREGRGKKASLT